jgi:DUF4097 and DUF4098 domain-containing protein YvlB
LTRSLSNPMHLHLCVLVTERYIWFKVKHLSNIDKCSRPLGVIDIQLFKKKPQKTKKRKENRRKLSTFTHIDRLIMILKIIKAEKLRVKLDFHFGDARIFKIKVKSGKKLKFQSINCERNEKFSKRNFDESLNVSRRKVYDEVEVKMLSATAMTLFLFVSKQNFA